MAKSLQRKKPGYTKAGVVKIVSLNIKQLTDLIAKTSKPKIQAKIQRRIQSLAKHQGLSLSEVTIVEAVVEE
jgi:hypothetical protein